MQRNKYCIEGMNFRGEGIASSADPNRKTVRIANAIEGEIVWATEVPFDPDLPRHLQKNITYLRSVETPSPRRVAPQCKHWQRCAMCQYACLEYEEQAKIKFDHWTKLISKFVDLSKLPNDIQFKPAIYRHGYRNRCEGLLSFDGIEPIFGIDPRDDAQFVERAETGKSLPIPMTACAMHTPELNRWIAQVKPYIEPCGFVSGTKFSFEANDDTSSARVIVYAMPDTAKKSRAATQKLAQFMAPTGAAFIFQELPPRGSHVYPTAESFGNSPWYAYDIEPHTGNVLCALKGAWTPVNPRHAHLIRQTLEEMSADLHFQHVCEIGCGCGTHTGVFAPKSERYTGIDASWPAIQSAQFNAHHATNWHNATFYTDTAEHYLDKRYFKGERSDAIILHSNRLPYSAHTAELCKRFGAQTLFIVGPTAYALAQECHHFTELGYRMVKLALCDTLPMSYHMMGVAMLISKP